MTRRASLPILALILLPALAASGCVSPDGARSCISDTGFPDGAQRYELSVDGTSVGEVTLEVADTPEERRVGLMGRESLARDRGMAFVYRDEAPRSFWMKNTLVPLDMVFLDSDLRVLNVETAEPRPNVSDAALERYRSDGAARYVLELNAGFAEEHGIGAGDTLDLCEVEP